MTDQNSYLILHGWAGNEPEHWQTWLAALLAAEGKTVRYPHLPDFDHPKLDAWLDTLDEELAGLAEDLVVACHSLGSILWMHHAARRSEGRIARAVLVAPPSPELGMQELADFFPVPLDPEGIAGAAAETILVCSDNDPYCPEGAKERFGDPLGIETVLVEGGRHLSVEAGYGDWPEMASLVVAGTR